MIKFDKIDFIACDSANATGNVTFWFRHCVNCYPSSFNSRFNVSNSSSFMLGLSFKHACNSTMHFVSLRFTVVYDNPVHCTSVLNKSIYSSDSICLPLMQYEHRKDAMCTR